MIWANIAYTPFDRGLIKNIRFVGEAKPTSARGDRGVGGATLSFPRL
jgi:hypothetical protein